MTVDEFTRRFEVLYGSFFERTVSEAAYAEMRESLMDEFQRERSPSD